jgi:hypothetical protein
MMRQKFIEHYLLFLIFNFKRTTETKNEEKLTIRSSCKNEFYEDFY